MAEVAPVLFSGGRCAGRTENRLLTDLQDGHVTCLNQHYDAHEVEQGYWLAVLPGVKVNPVATIESNAPARAYQRQVHAMHVTVPAQVSITRQATARLLRRARR